MGALSRSATPSSAAARVLVTLIYENDPPARSAASPRFASE
jgi:hypothetical protein